MATWLEVESYLTSNYVTEKLDLNCLKFVFELGDGRSQMIFVAGLGLDGPDDPVVFFASPFATTSMLSPQQVVDLMRESAIGIGEWHECYVVKHLAPLENLDANELEWPLAYVTRMADMLEEKLGIDVF
jgi:hypothetical protein